MVLTSMADDMDRLLNEVEEKYLKNTTVNSFSTINSGANDNNNLGDIVDDLCFSIDNWDTPMSTMPLTRTAKESITCIENEQRCFPLYLGGSSMPTGQATTGNKWTCSTLRCLNCDFKICHFDDYEWSSSTDYLFLRNHMPDFARLKSNLIMQKGSRAYACQCRWENVQSLTELKPNLDLKWICGKH